MATEFEDDLHLARRVVRGEPDAFEEFYSLHADLVFTFIFHRLNGAGADAEEIWQETILAGIRVLPNYRGESRLSSWLCGIARHKVADHCRSRATASRVESVIAPDLLQRMIDGGPLPEAFQQSAACAHVVESLAGLTSDCREALLARYVDGATVEAVAERLGRSYKATESLLSRARAALRQRLLSSWEANNE